MAVALGTAALALATVEREEHTTVLTDPVEDDGVRRAGK